MLTKTIKYEKYFISASFHRNIIHFYLVKCDIQKYLKLT